MLLAALLLVSTPAVAQMSPVGCNALSASADEAAAAIDKSLDQMKGDAFRAAMPHMPEKAKPAAADVEDARISAEMAMREYTHSLRDFATKIQNCGQ
ncbi:hypothetical protein [Mesorhizobium amorphae]|uniref:hypothetical protein n=1 Tax=Mesorhizobium amorphae TaxID=71433 RepID=UPI0017863506|nr:hypothetical protein [Mesorhizobium amorphae]